LARSEECQGSGKTLNQAPAGSRAKPIRAEDAPIYFGLVWTSTYSGLRQMSLCSVFKTGKMSNLDKRRSLRIW
jgi:hypothetical protein